MSEDLFDGGSSEPVDIEDLAGSSSAVGTPPVIISTSAKRKRTDDTASETRDAELTKSWREVLGNPPPVGNTKVEYTLFITCMP